MQSIETNSPRQGVVGLAKYLADQGRNGDDVIVHATSGEAIVPRQILEQNPKLQKDLFSAFGKEGVDPEQYLVGSGVMSINPETNLPEFGFWSKSWKSVRKVVKKAGPIIGATIGFMVGGPIGAAIGSGIATKTRGDSWGDSLKNAAMAYMGANMAQGAGAGAGNTGGITSLFKGSTWANTFNPANWTPMASGQAGIGGFFQNVGSGAARSLGIGGAQTLTKAGLTPAQASQVYAEMQASGVSAAQAAGNLGLKLPGNVMSNLATAGPGFTKSLVGGYASLNPLQQWAVKQIGSVGLGLHEETGDVVSGGEAPEYLTSGLRAGSPRPSKEISGAATGLATANMNPFSGQAGQYAQRDTVAGGGPTPVGRSSGSAGTGGTGGLGSLTPRIAMDLEKGNKLLDQQASALGGRANRERGALGSLLLPFPEFDTSMPARQPPVMANLGGFIGSDRTLFAGGGFSGHARGPGGPKDDLIDAKLSNNEFVMTARAVEGAGDGNVEKGARKMYQLMHQLEGAV